MYATALDCFTAADATALPLYLVAGSAALEAPGLSDQARAYMAASDFKGKAGEKLMLPGADGRFEAALLGLGEKVQADAIGRAPLSLPEGNYRVDHLPGGMTWEQLALYWGLGAYQFTRYRKASRASAMLVCDDAIARSVRAVLEGTYLTRDLVNTPAEDLGPTHIGAAMDALAEPFGAKVHHVVGDDLLRDNYPLVHAVGRTAKDAPRLSVLSWGAPGAPRVTLVGKGVAFDTGGLNLKPGNYMGLMKKDMGGAATVMGLGHMIMAHDLPVQLTIIVPAVENGIGAGAFRPGDVFPSRKGLTVEIENTDAEGRLILADALALACEETPDLLIDFATLTGAARVALGPDLAPIYCDDDAFTQAVRDAGTRVGDPVWRMPLHDGYGDELDSKIADICHTSPSPMAGSITAALFLKRFVDAPLWAHFDIFAWNPKAKGIKPYGGELLAGRAVVEVLKERYRRT